MRMRESAKTRSWFRCSCFCSSASFIRRNISCWPPETKWSLPSRSTHFHELRKWAQITEARTAFFAVSRRQSEHIAFWSAFQIIVSKMPWYFDWDRITQFLEWIHACESESQPLLLWLEWARRLKKTWSVKRVYHQYIPDIERRILHKDTEIRSWRPGAEFREFNHANRLPSRFYTFLDYRTWWYRSSWRGLWFCLLVLRSGTARRISFEVTNIKMALKDRYLN